MKKIIISMSCLSILLFSFHLDAADQAKAILHDVQGREVGFAAFTESKNGVHIRIVVNGLKPGEHGVHLHEIGKCDPPDFKSAGGHFNPNAKKHGFQNLEGSHQGDMPNLLIHGNGRGKLNFVLKEAHLKTGKNPLLQSAGISLVIHAEKDDEKTDPSGNSGARIICGVVSALTN